MLRNVAIWIMGTNNEKKLESRLANQSDSDSLIANEFYASTASQFKVTGIVSLKVFGLMKWYPNSCVKTCQCLTFKVHFMAHTFS